MHILLTTNVCMCPCTYIHLACSGFPNCKQQYKSKLNWSCSFTVLCNLNVRMARVLTIKFPLNKGISMSFFIFICSCHQTMTLGCTQVKCLPSDVLTSQLLEWLTTSVKCGYLLILFCYSPTQLSTCQLLHFGKI